VPADGQRDVPDISVSASADHDGYLFCSEDAAANTCTSGFRDSAGGGFAIVGGTSVAAPTLSAIFTLVNQFLGNAPPSGLGNINPKLYQLAASNPAAFNDVKTGDNIVPCTQGTTNCPATAPFQYGFSAGVGYDQVTGLGSINAFTLAQAWAATRTPTATSLSSPTSNTFEGASVTFTATVTPSNAVGTVNFFNGSTTPIGTKTLSGGSAAFTTSSLPVGTNSVTATYTGSGTLSNSNSSAVSVTVVTPNITLTPSVATATVTRGSTATVGITVSSTTSGFVTTTGGNTTTALPLTYSCSGLPAESTCTFSPPSPTTTASVTVAIKTTAPTGKLLPPLGRSNGIFYASLVPGLLGIVFTSISRKRREHSLRLLGLLVVLGFSTLWLASCGGSNNNSNKDPGTPTGPATVTINATTGGSSPATGSTQFTLQVN
jgi:hypothetical protein